MNTFADTSDLDKILATALGSRVTDLHLETSADGYRIRERGVLGLRTSSCGGAGKGATLLNALCHRSGLELSGEIQEGRLDAVDQTFRVSLLPTVDGYSAVLRLLPKTLGDSGKCVLSGFSGRQRTWVEEALQAPSGWILLCGPTGSGKTTTLYELMECLNHAEKKLVSIEDPVERRLYGVIQSEVDPGTGWTYAEAFRCMLRHDPDVILIGEIRNDTTAAVALRAAMTGHRVLASVHSADAVGVVDRLEMFGLSTRLQAEAHTLTISRRLYPRNCPDCRHPMRHVDSRELADFGVQNGFESTGCLNCRFSGRLGWVPVAGMIRWTDSLKDFLIRLNRGGKIEGALDGECHTPLTEAVLNGLKAGEIPASAALSFLQGTLSDRCNRRRGWS